MDLYAYMYVCMPVCVCLCGCVYVLSCCIVFPWSYLCYLSKTLNSFGQINAIYVCIEFGMSSIRYASNYATSCLFGSLNGVRIAELSP